MGVYMENLKNIFDDIKTKDSTAFDLFYKEYFRLIYGIAFSIAKNEATSYDVVQNIMVKLFVLDSDKFPQKNELSWLYTVIKNEALQVLRKEKESINIDDIDNISIQQSNIDDFVDMDNYYSMIKTLNDNQKQIVTLKVMCGLKHKEIAKLLNMPIGTVQWIYNSATVKLRAKYLNFFIVIATLGASFIYRLYKDLNTESLGEVGIASTPSIKKLTVVLGAAFVCSVLITIIYFFKKISNKPTKA